jgi:hypothetical protein
MPERLETYVGPNWESHYRQPFEALLKAQYTGTRVGWTWNWSAALLFPFWLLYRRLYLAFLVALILFSLASAVLELGSGFSPIMGLLVILAQGWAGDRLLFDKAFAVVGSTGDRAWLARAGRPLRLVAWGAWTWAAVSVMAGLMAEMLPKPEVAWREGKLSDLAILDTVPATRVVTSRDGRSRITVPGKWLDIPRDAGKAELQVGDPGRDQYLALMTVSREDVAKGVSLDRFARRMIQNMRDNLTDVSVSDPERMAVQGRSAVLYEVRATEDDLRVVYWITSVEGERGYHTVLAWTLVSRAAETEPLYRKSVESFQEIPPEAPADAPPPVPTRAM